MALKGSFIGFSYGTTGNMIHSSKLGIIRTSDGDRFNDTLTPTFKDINATTNGRDGVFYFGTQQTQKQFSFNIAFDDLDDTQLRQIRNLFNEKGLHQFIFDEWPYKVYTVRPNGNQTLKYIAYNKPLDDVNYDYQDTTDLYSGGVEAPAKRIYKGEGTLSFITYEPWAISRFKYKDEYIEANIPEWKDVNLHTTNGKNLREWIDSVNFKNSTYSVNNHIIDAPIECPVGGTLTSPQALYYNNPGDLDTDNQIIVIPKDSTTYVPSISISCDGNSLEIDNVLLTGSSEAYCIDSKLHLILGCYKKMIEGKDYWYTNGIIYNQYITVGDFFKIPVTTAAEYMSITIGETYISNLDKITLDYKYLFY